jgi:hypothetical protein
MTSPAALAGIRVAICCTRPQPISTPRYWLPTDARRYHNLKNPPEAAARRRDTPQKLAGVAVLLRSAYQAAEL